MGLLNKPSTPAAPASRPPASRPAPASKATIDVAKAPIQNRTFIAGRMTPAQMLNRQTGAVAPKAAPPRSQAPVPAQRQAPDLRRIFSGGIKTAQVRAERNPFLRGGHYILKILSTTMEENRHGEAFAALDFEVRAVLGVSADGDTPHSVGENVRHMIKRKMESFFEQVKKFVAVAGDGAVDDVDDEDVILTMGEGQPMRGKYLEVMAINNPNKKWAKEGDPRHFTNPSYRRLLSDEEVALVESGGNPAPVEQPEDLAADFEQPQE